ncbi:class I SAM-dependent methyltransferase [Verrucomicrobia bacterium]|nr:class I SAM-dependent methyltransferase [Verrucomicrobiota bacterium]
MGHQETYHHNKDYAEFLSGWETRFYRKYADAMMPENPETSVLDVGCGVGQVVAELSRRGVNVHGVDVSLPNIERARQRVAQCHVYDGAVLPFSEGQFGVVGAFNVLEHVDEPEIFLRELVRVVCPGGRIIVSSPNFFRVIGFRDYHPHMRGPLQKLSNLRRLLQKRRLLKGPFQDWRFDRMKPIVKEPFTADDDAVVATNPMEIARFLSHYGCRIESIACTDRPVPGMLDFLLNLGPWKYAMFNGFVIARRCPETPC